MWKRLFIVLFFGFASYAYSSESLIEDVAKTDQSLQAESNFEDRVRIVNEFVERVSQRQESLIRKIKRTDEEIVTMFRAYVLQNFHDRLDTSSSTDCIGSLDSAKATLYPNRLEETMLPFEQSIYDVYEKMCAP